MPPTVRFVRFPLGLLCCAALLAGCFDRIRAPEEPPNTVRQGDESFRIERYADAITKYRLFLDETGQSAYTPRVFYKTALAEYRLGRYKDTLATLDALSQRYPRAYWVQVDALRGDALRALGKRVPALESWDAGWRLGNANERDKLSRRVIAVANELTDAELEEARDEVRNGDVRDLLDEQIASRKSPEVGEPVPEAAEETPEAPSGQATGGAKPEALGETAATGSTSWQQRPEHVTNAPAPEGNAEIESLKGEAPSAEPPKAEAPQLEPDHGLGAAAAPPHPSATTTQPKRLTIPPIETGPPETTPDDSGAVNQVVPAQPQPQARAAEPAAAPGARASKEKLAAVEVPAAAAAKAPTRNVLAEAPHVSTKIGCLLPLSGPNRPAGERALRGVHLVFGEDSDRVILKDTMSDKRTALQMYNELSRDPNVLLVVGPFGDGDSAGMARGAEETRLPLVLASASEGPGGQYVFKLGTPRSQLLRTLLDYAVEKARLRRFGALYPRDAYGKDFLSAFRAEAQRHGAQVIVAESYLPETTGIALSALKRWRDDKNVQAIFMADSATAAARYAQFLQREMPDIMLLGIDDWEQLASQSNGSQLTGVLFTNGFYAASARPATRAFVALFERTYGETPGAIEAAGYEAALLAKRALDAGANSRSEALHQLRTLGTVDGPTGTVRVTPAGVHQDPFLLQVQDGKIQEIGAANAS